MAIEKDLKTILGKLKYSDDAKVVAQITDQMKQVQARMAGIKHKLVVMSGKGGVGKSMTTVNLALALARQHARVGLLDVDLNGPCVPRMLGLHGRSLTMTPEGALPPVGPLGVKVASMDFFLGAASPVRWKGPMDVSPVWLGLMEMNVIREFLADVMWGELDYLLADLPQGSGWRVEEVLIRIAGESAPQVSLGDDPAARKACRDRGRFTGWIRHHTFPERLAARVSHAGGRSLVRRASTTCRAMPVPIRQSMS